MTISLAANSRTDHEQNPQRFYLSLLRVRTANQGVFYSDTARKWSVLRWRIEFRTSLQNESLCNERTCVRDEKHPTGKTPWRSEFMRFCIQQRKTRRAKPQHSTSPAPIPRLPTRHSSFVIPPTLAATSSVARPIDENANDRRSARRRDRS
jgi:hypothetical protein